tara:strand:+ start:196 stop:321 length:126 start_codon:yes stop_codon:yes gene_type:complete
MNWENTKFGLSVEIKAPRITCDFIFSQVEASKERVLEKSYY